MKWILLLGLAIGLGGAAACGADQEPAPGYTPSPSGGAGSNHSLGSKDAPLVVVEYADFQ